MKLSSYLIVVLACAISIEIFNRLYISFDEEKSQEINEYVAIFHEEMDKRGLKDLDFSNIDIALSSRLNLPNAVGLSYPSLYSRYIRLKKEYFRRASKEIKEALIAHELGHTFGLLTHTDGFMWTFPEYRIKFCPISVMHSSDDLSGCFLSHRKYYYDELASQIKKLDKKTNML